MVGESHDELCEGREVCGEVSAVDVEGGVPALSEGPAPRVVLEGGAAVDGNGPGGGNRVRIEDSYAGAGLVLSDLREQDEEHYYYYYITP